MLVTRRFGDVELVFQIEQPFVLNQRDELEQSKKWMVQIHRGTVSWLAGGPLLDDAGRTALFDTIDDAVKSAIAYAHSRGLQD